MGEKKNRKTKGTTLALGIPLNKGRRGVAGAWTRVYFNANICLFLNGAGFISSIFSPSLFLSFFGGFLVMKNVGFVFCSHMSCWYFFSI